MNNIQLSLLIQAFKESNKSWNSVVDEVGVNWFSPLLPIAKLILEADPKADLPEEVVRQLRQWEAICSHSETVTDDQPTVSSEPQYSCDHCGALGWNPDPRCPICDVGEAWVIS